MKDNKILVIITAVLIMVSIVALFDTAPKVQPAASSTGDTTLTVKNTPALELESYQNTTDAYSLQPATVNIQN